MLQIKQTGIIIACLLIGTALYMAPRTALSGSENSAPVSQDMHFDEVFKEQLSNVKSKLEPAALFTIEKFEDALENASNSQTKLIMLDSLIQLWDKLMRPGIAAEYVVKKAEITNDGNIWKLAGRRYTDMLPFFNTEDKILIGERAIFCLEQAQNLLGVNEESETLLAIAKVEGSDDPMSGILKLRGLAESNPLNKEAQLNLGYFSMQTGQYDKAIERFNAVLAADPSELVVKFYISEAYLSAGDKSAAVKALEEFITMVDPLEKESIEEAKKRIKNIIN